MKALPQKKPSSALGVPLALLAAFACLLLGASQAGAACPNEGLREAQGVTALPACMALEMVSPPKKFALPAWMPSFSADGDRVVFRSPAALAGSPGSQSFNGDRYVATRGGAGWSVAPTSPPPAKGIVSGGHNFGGPGIFTPDLTGWAQLGATQVQDQIGQAQLFSGGLDGTFAPLSPLMTPIDNSGSNELPNLVVSLDIDGASADLSSVVIRLNHSTIFVSYLPGDPKGPTKSEAGGGRNSYVAFLANGVPSLALLARDEDGTVWGGRCGANIGGLGGGGASTLNQGAISADGSRIYFSTRPAQPFDSELGEGPLCALSNPTRILERTITEDGVQITPLLAGGQSEWEEAGDDLFQGASADGTKVYFTTTRALSSSDSDPTTEECRRALGFSQGCDLYLYDSSKPEGERLIHVSAGEDADPADVLSTITAISRDGSDAYFAAEGALTSAPNVEGASAIEGEPNLYSFDAQSDQLSFIGTLSAGDLAGMWGAEGSFFGDAYATPDALVFASKAPLTADDEDGGHRDVFRYDASSGALQRISKAVTGGSDNGPFDATVNPIVGQSGESNLGDQARWVAEDGEAIAFATAEPLTPGDGDEANNPYLWKAGELGGVQAEVAYPPAISAGGEEIAFSTSKALFPQDGDSALDVYVAREGGGYPLPVPSTQCDPLQEGSCQRAIDSPKAPGAPASAGFSGPGNVREPARCRRPLVKRRGRCVKKKRQHKGRSGRRANKRRGGGR